MKRKVELQSSTMTKRRVILSLYVSETNKKRATLQDINNTIDMGFNYEMQILR